nr:hypothetical protein [Tanacetum cinerariifolium]
MRYVLPKRRDIIAEDAEIKNEYEVFYDDHVKEISSGSTTTHSDSSLYDSFIFDLSMNPFPPVDKSDFYEFIDELTYIISPPEYAYFFFKIEPNSGDFTMDVVEDIFATREPRDRPIVCYYDDDEDYAIAVTPSLSTEEPDNSLRMGDEHLDTVLIMESDEFIKSSVGSLVPIPRNYEGWNWSKPKELES